MRRFSAVAVILACLGAGSPSPPTPAELLPPELPWEGRSLSLMVGQDDPWVTPAERTDLTATPRYEETVDWLRRLVAEAPELEMVSLGMSPEGREIWMVVASAEGASTPEALAKLGKPVLLVHGGIHAGEIDGKDAGLMLLRDLTVRNTKRQLLDDVSLLFVPILNVDGHERFSPYGRVNQRGPESMGWRTNKRNLNLNRDFAKLDTPEVRALIAAIERWQPDLYLDLHVTDGADYQYDVTFGYTGPHGYSPAIARWLDERFRPRVEQDLKAMGHVPGPLIFLADEADPAQGNFGWVAEPRYSNGYGDARHLPSVLVENHSLKPYRQRVLGTYVLLEGTLRTLAAHGAELRAAVAQDRARRRDPLPLTFQMAADRPPKTFRFLGVESTVELSPISGAPRVRWTGRPVELEIPLLENTEPALVASRPVAYWIPPTWPEVIEVLEAHGVRLERQPRAVEREFEMYRLEDAQIEPMAFEGRVRVEAQPVAERRRELYPAGSVRVPVDQPLGDLAMLLLEPAAPDSFFRWGFFLEVLQRTEYMEAYAVEPLAERMLAEDPALAAEFRQRLASDREFAGNARARLQWFYQRTPYWDDRWLLYPVAREID